MKEFSNRKRLENLKVGLVPTMGFLHEGHLSLVRKLKSISDVSIVSIFVNPAQFSPDEDLITYPRDFDRDEKLLKELDVDVIFYPDGSEIYPTDFQTYVTVNKISKFWEGESRPTHFRGVTTIVNILFNIIQPEVAIFGQKDAQQAAVINQMVKDLKMNVSIVVNSIVREHDGLAMSSRNIYLNTSERKDAKVLYNSLQKAKSLIQSGESDSKKIIKSMKTIINSVESSKLDYIAIVEKESFESVEKLVKGGAYYILIACYIGKTRLIDNYLLSV